VAATHRHLSSDLEVGIVAEPMNRPTLAGELIEILVQASVARVSATSRPRCASAEPQNSRTKAGPHVNF
jgi:hypothetical protein